MAIKLRYYQEDALAACRDAYHRGVHRVLVSLATGLGKTVILSSMPKYVIPKKDDCTVVLVNRDELVGQTLEKIETVSPGAYSGIEKGTQKAKGDEEFVVASVYTLHERRIDDFFRRMKGRVGLLIADEAHHATAPQYARIFEKFFKERPDGFLVGVTATPQRGDGIGLGSAFDETVYHRDMRWAIQEGWLVPVRCFNVATNTNLDSVETRMGDFAPEQLAKVIDDVQRNNIAVSAYLEHGRGKKGIVFAPTVAHARHINDVFVARGVKSQWANGTFKKKDRENIVNDFRSGNLEMLVNVALWCVDTATEILTESGWKTHDTISYDDLVANWSEGHITFSKPKRIIKRERTEHERMVVLKTRYRSIRVTEDHRMVFGTPYDPKWRKEPAKEIVNKAVFLPISGIAEPFSVDVEQPPQLTTAEIARRISALSYNYRKADPLLSLKDSKNIAEARLRDRLSLRYLEPKELNTDQCRFIGLWLGDGNKAKLSTGGIEYKICSTNAIPPLLEKIREVVKSSGSEYIERITKSTNNNLKHTFHLPRGTGFSNQKRDGLFSIKPYLAKSGTDLYWGLNDEQFAALLHGLWLADGQHGDGEKRCPSQGIRIVSGRKELCDLLQAIATCRGYRTTLRKRQYTEHGIQLMRAALTKINKKQGTASFKPLWDISFRQTEKHQCSIQTPEMSALQFEKDEWQKETVWCVETESGNIVTRRHGTVTVMGNCEGFDVPDVEVMIGVRPTQSRALFCQMVGRILRPDSKTAGLISRAATPEERRQIIADSVKPTALLLDLVDQTRKLGLISLPTLWGLPPKFHLHGEDIEEVKQAIEQLEAYDPIAAYDLMTKIDQEQTAAAFAADETAVIGTTPTPDKDDQQAGLDIDQSIVKPEEPIPKEDSIQQALTKIVNNEEMRPKTVFEHIATKLAEVSAFAPPELDEKISAVSSLAWRQSTVSEDDFYLELPERRTAFHKDGTPIRDFGRIYRECEETAKKTRLNFEEHLQERCPHDPELVRVAQDSVRIHKVDNVYQAEFSWDGQVKVLGQETNIARAFGRTERWIENNRKDIVSALSARAPWRAKQPTMKQINVLRNEFDVPLHLIPANRGEADMLIKKLLDERGGRISESATS